MLNSKVDHQAMTRAFTEKPLPSMRWVRTFCCFCTAVAAELCSVKTFLKTEDAIGTEKLNGLGSCFEKYVQKGGLCGAQDSQYAVQKGEKRTFLL